MKTSQSIILVLFALFLFPFQSLKSQSYINREWVGYAGIPDTIDYIQSTIDNAGQLIVTSNEIISGQDADILTVKYADDGTVVWQNHYNGASNGKDYGMAVTTDMFGNVYVTGASYNSSSNFDYVIIKYDVNGNQEWAETYNGNGNLYDIPTAIAVDANGDIYVTGGSFSLSNQTDYLTLKYDNNGNFQWSAVYDYVNLNEGAVGISIDNSGSIYITGASENSANVWDCATIKYDNTGTQININRVSAAGVSFDKVTDIEQDIFGNVIVVGSAFNSNTNSYDIKILKLNPSLSLQWVVDFDAEGLDDMGNAIATDSYGNIYVVGYVSTSHEGKNFIVLKYDTFGNEVWNKTQNYGAVSEDDMAIKVSLDADDYVYVVGQIDKGTETDYLTIKYDENGNKIWEEEYKRAGNDKPSDIKVDNDRNIYVSGQTYNGTNYQITSIKYSAITLPFDPVYINDSIPYYEQNQILIRFDSAVVKREVIDRTEINYGSVATFLKPNIVTLLQTKLQAQGVDIDDCKLLRVFTNLKSTHTTSISRLGEAVNIPDLWSAFILIYPKGEISEIEQVLADSIETLFPLVHYTELCYYVEPTWNTNDPLTNLQTNLHITPVSWYAHVSADSAWTLETGKPFVKIGYFDSGVNAVHEDLATDTLDITTSIVKGGWDFYTNAPILNTPYSDSTGHGTAGVGIVHARRNNHIGIAGIAGGDSTQEGCSAYMLKILGPFGPNGSVSLPVIANAILQNALQTPDSAYGFGLHIQNHSWVTTSNAPISGVKLLSEATYQAFRNKVIFVAARGNSGDNDALYPACFDDDWVINVGGTGTYGSYDNTASYGYNVDIAAPSSQVSHTTWSYNPPWGYLTNIYRTHSGTSAATNNVVGAAGLLLSYVNNPLPNYLNLAPEDVEHVLEFTADDRIDSIYCGPGYDEYTGFGRLNVTNSIYYLEKPNRCIHHYDNISFPDTTTFQVTGMVNVDIELSENYKNNIGQNFIAGKYKADIYAAKTKVIHSLSPTEIIDTFWVRNSSSNLFGLYDTVGGVNILTPHEKIRILSLNQDTAFLLGYAYLLSDTFGLPIGWLPFDTYTTIPEFAYSIVVSGCDSQFVAVNNSLSSESAIALYPNPSDNYTTLQFYLPQNEHINIQLFDLTGRLIDNVCNENKLQGDNKIHHTVSHLSNGVYFYKVQIGNKIQTLKFIKL